MNDIAPNLAPKHAIVTGASRGIGRAAALRLARDGFAVVINYAGNHDKAAEVVKEITGKGGRAMHGDRRARNPITSDLRRLAKCRQCEAEQHRRQLSAAIGGPNSIADGAQGFLDGPVPSAIRSTARECTRASGWPSAAGTAQSFSQRPPARALSGGAIALLGRAGEQEGPPCCRILRRLTVARGTARHGGQCWP